jgi:hypothetical protein
MFDASRREIMTKYDEELRKRLLRGDAIPEVMEWLVATAAADPSYSEGGLTELEATIWRDLGEDYKEWRRKLTRH